MGRAQIGAVRTTRVRLQTSRQFECMSSFPRCRPHGVHPMPRHNRPSVSHPIALAVFLLSVGAEAQVDVSPPRPNVLLLVDSSGSMEYKTSSTNYPKCDPTGNTASEKSRWIDLVEVLTGTIPSYRCQALTRNASTFQSEYKVAGAYPAGTLNPADFLYPLPYHRPMSGACAPRPGATPDTIRYCSHTTTTCSTSNCDFPKAQGGLLDAFATEVRFGLMTFDTLPNPDQALAGTWSYIGGGTSAKGAPIGCGVLA